VPGGADQVYPYKPHPQYRWLTDRSREGGVIAFDPKEGWHLFEPPITEQELVWGGSDAPVGRPIQCLTEWIRRRPGRPVAGLGCISEQILVDEKLSKRLHILLDHTRRPKDAMEVYLMRRSATATSAGYAAIKEVIQPGRSEREVQVEFEAAIARAGADGVGYATIVGSGPNSAVLHGKPSARRILEGDLVLVDAGAEVEGYVTDVTRTFPANGHFSEDQKWFYKAVLKALETATQACRVGIEWLDVHLIAAYSLAESLAEAGMLTCSPEEALESEAISLFFPHGIGHMVGLGVRDAGGPLPGRNGDRTAAGSKIRMDLPLEAGYTVTIEPGIYFIPAVLTDSNRREKFKTQVNWCEVNPWIGRGGIRIEDNVLVTSGSPIVLTEAIPK